MKYTSQKKLYLSLQMDESAIPLLGSTNLPYDRVRDNPSATAVGAATIIVLWPVHVGRICIILTTIIAFVCLAGIVVWTQKRVGTLLVAAKVATTNNREGQNTLFFNINLFITFLKYGNVWSEHKIQFHPTLFCKSLA